MNENKIVFIISVNNELYYDECCWYLNQLLIPENFETDIITIREATSMAEAYNAGMENTDAKYKVYIHQDVFICNRNFIADMLKIFRANEKIGMLGLIGGVKLPESGVIYNAWNCGRTIVSDWSLAVDTCFYQKEPYVIVEALDGMLLATQHDVRWREDILKQWDFYDISQSFEFIKAGYHIAIPFQDTAWSIHDCGYSNLINYNENRKIIFNEYPDFFSEDWDGNKFKYNYELQVLTGQLYMEIEKLIDQGRCKEAENLLSSFNENGMIKNMPLLRQIFTISKMEKEVLESQTVLSYGLSTSELLERYTKIRFFLRRLEVGESTEIKDILVWIQVNRISPIEIMFSIIHNLVDRKRVFDLITKAYRLGNDAKNAIVMETFSKKMGEKYYSISKKDEEYIFEKQSEAEYWLKNNEKQINMNF